MLAAAVGDEVLKLMVGTAQVDEDMDLSIREWRQYILSASGECGSSHAPYWPAKSFERRDAVISSIKRNFFAVIGN